MPPAVIEVRRDRRSHRRRSSGRRGASVTPDGLSLVEVLLGTSVLLVLAFMYFQVFVGGATATSLHALRLEALNEARGLLERLRGLPLDSAEIARLDENRMLEIRGGTLSRDMYRAVLRYRVEAINPRTRRVRAWVDWAEGRDDHRRSLGLTTVLAQSRFHCSTTGGGDGGGGPDPEGCYEVCPDNDRWPCGAICPIE
jgi:hypothetical protein